MNVRRLIDGIKSKVYFILFGYKDERVKNIKGKMCDVYFFEGFQLVIIVCMCICVQGGRRVYRCKEGNIMEIYDFRKYWCYQYKGIYRKCGYEFRWEERMEFWCMIGFENVSYLYFYFNKFRQLILLFNF